MAQISPQMRLETVELPRLSAVSPGGHVQIPSRPPFLHHSELTSEVARRILQRSESEHDGLGTYEG
jgi:hypothetical protein